MAKAVLESKRPVERAAKGLAWARIRSTLDRHSIRNWFVGAFVLIAGVAGTSFALLLPPFQVPDEAAHFSRAYATSHFTCHGSATTRVPESIMDLIARFPARIDQKGPDVREKAWGFLRHPFETGPITPPAVAISNESGNLYNCMPYVAGATAIAVGRLAHAPALIVFYAGRLANLFVYILITSLALALMPGYRLPLFAVALLPMTLHQAASFSADGATMSLSFLLMAFCLHLAFRARRLAARDYAALGFVAAALSLSKFNIWSSLLVLLIPSERFGGRNRRLMAFAATLILMTSVAGGWQWINSDNVQTFEQIRKEKFQIDMAENARVLSSEPAVFAHSVLRSFDQHGRDYFEMFVGMLGPLTMRLPAWHITAFQFLLPACLIFWDTNFRLRVSQRALFLVFVAATVLSLFSLLWILETSRSEIAEARSGIGVIEGIQGRYFIPFAPALMIACSVPLIRLGRRTLLLIALTLGLFNAAALRFIYDVYNREITTMRKVHIVAAGNRHSVIDGARLEAIPNGDPIR